MVWLAVDKKGSEYAYSPKPHRGNDCWCYKGEKCCCSITKLKKGVIKKLIGKSLTWEDEPVELKSYSHG